MRRALHRAGPRLVDAIRRARADEIPDRRALADWAGAYGRDLLVFHRTELTVVRSRLDEATALTLDASMGAEHDELAAAAADAEQVLLRWADDAADGRAVLAAVRAALDDLLVHDAHETAALDRAVATRGGPLDPDGHLVVEALRRAPLVEPPFLGPLTLADADPLERRLLLQALPAPLAGRWTAAEATHADATRRAMGA